MKSKTIKKPKKGKKPALNRLLNKARLIFNKYKKKFRSKNKSQKIIIWMVIVFTIINFLLVLGFFIYLYLWVKGR